MAASTVEIGVLAPPFEPAEAEPLSHGPLLFGSVLLCRFGHCLPPPEELASALAETRRTHPIPPIIAVVEGSETAIVDVIRQAGRVPFRAVVSSEELAAGSLRCHLTNPADLARDLAGWTIQTAEKLSWSTRGILKPFLQAEGWNPQTSAVDQRFLRNVRDHLRRDGLPPPTAWRRLLRCLRVALAAQRDRETHLGRIALDHGFSDQPALCKAFRGIFGMPATEARRLLGWEWLTALFLAHRGRPRGCR